MSGKITWQQGQTILFTGDSITDADHNNPTIAPFGCGYVNFAANFLTANHSQLDLNIINTGISGNTTRDLLARWDSDCIAHKPDILSLMIGINDLVRRYADTQNSVYPDEYEANCTQILSQALETCNCRIVLIEPFLFCGDPENEKLKALQDYIAIIHKLAQQFDATLVKLQDKINSQILQTPQQKWSDDMVHPFPWAHAWIAQRWLNACD